MDLSAKQLAQENIDNVSAVVKIIDISFFIKFSPLVNNLNKKYYNIDTNRSQEIRKISGTKTKTKQKLDKNYAKNKSACF